MERSIIALLIWGTIAAISFAISYYVETTIDARLNRERWKHIWLLASFNRRYTRIEQYKRVCRLMGAAYYPAAIAGAIVVIEITISSAGQPPHINELINWIWPPFILATGGYLYRAWRNYDVFKH